MIDHFTPAVFSPKIREICSHFSRSENLTLVAPLLAFEALWSGRFAHRPPVNQALTL